MGLQESNYMLSFLLASCCCTGLTFGNPTSCDEVRKVFQLRQIGPIKLLPLNPKSGSDLQVCMSRNLSCCTVKMEVRYQVAARRDLQNLLQTSSSSLKFLIARNVAAFQDAFDLLLKRAENQTNVVLRESYGRMAHQASGPIGELFTDIGLFLLGGSELGVDDLVGRFFGALFPLVYSHLVDPGPGDIAPGYAECVRSASRDLRPFGAAPAALANRIARSGVSGKLLLQALHLGIEVINTTDHMTFSRECRRGLLKMSFCPHCQGLTRSKPCMGYCLNVMRGCLASMAEIDAHWREFVRSLEGLSARMQGPHDLERVLLGVHVMLRDAVAHAQKNGPRLSAQVHKVCGTPTRTPAQGVSVQNGIRTPAQGVSVQNGIRRESIPLKATLPETGDSLAVKRKEFLNSLRLYRTYYGGLSDQLCVSELASGDGLSCWNGADIVKSYTLRVVGNGIKAQMANPEVKVKGTDPVIHQIIDKLKHINQLLQGKSIPKLGTLDQIETGSGDADGHYSGDCDDEDGCDGSGGGETKTKVLRVSKLSPDDVGSEHRRHRHPHGEEEEEEEADMEGSRSRSSSRVRLTGAGWAVVILTCSQMIRLAL